MIDCTHPSLRTYTEDISMARSTPVGAAALATALMLFMIAGPAGAADSHGHGKAAQSAAKPESKAAASHGEDGHADEGNHDEGPKGPNGGALTTVKQGSVELLLVEEGGKLVAKVWAQAGAKPVPVRDLKVTAEVERPGGAKEMLTFSPAGDSLVSRQQIAEPHLFTLHAQVSWPGLPSPIEAELEKEEGKLSLSAEQTKLAGLTIEAVGPGDLSASLRLPGEIRLNADRVSHVVPRVSGVVQSVAADLGQQVKKGQVLATISSPALSDMRSELRAAQRRRELASTTLRREERLWREQVSAEQDYLQARATHAESDIAVDNAAQKLRAIGAAGEGGDLSLLTLRAPFDGVVVEKHISLGEALADSANIFTIADLRTVWAEFTVAAKDIGAVRVGETARVTAAGSEGSASGKVSYVGALLGQQTRAATARITLDNAGGAWRPGLFVTVDVVTDTSRAAVTVLAEAVQTIDNTPTVFVAVHGGFAPVPVKIGRSAGNRVEILAGLESGTQYAARNAYVLKAEQGKASAEHSH